MTKYEPVHEWVKTLKLKGPLAQFADSATDNIGKQIDNTNISDWAYILSFACATYLAYEAITTVGHMNFWDWFKAIFMFPGAPTGLWTLVPEGNLNNPELFKNMDWNALVMAIPVAYMTINTSASDITSAITMIKGMKA